MKDLLSLLAYRPRPSGRQELLRIDIEGTQEDGFLVPIRIMEQATLHAGRPSELRHESCRDTLCQTASDVVSSAVFTLFDRIQTMIPNHSQLILLPGLLCDADLWLDQVESLRDVATCHVADLTFGDTVEELADIILGHAAPTFALAGFSFGGYVAQEIVKRAPERVARLALLDTSFKADTSERKASRHALAAAARLPGRFEGISGRLLSTFISPERMGDTVLVDRIKAMTKRVGRDVFIRQSMMPRPDGEAVLRGLHCPTLILCGRQDALTPLPSHEEMAALIPHALLTVIDDCGHMAPMEKPVAVTAALRHWLCA